ncbi:pyrroline-5-carboxylate reductase [Paracoccus denitrificans]|jgi:pyrroline-5-carboxylate reductase|uniref:Pyrroline-5-carboxylate reductase n=1 Tax=Paracoccus denitrificans (strain Pd 1222) TaxID=318586 RepID=A1BBN7_PARDP|nr:pyrroline-5-carboxylate reductase [Paracoccus denitrificans]ABL72931.1 pyrroline-5-carboxylate reductase [Paracoccus denitrificans PD1222]MBB4626410.1 pyrroline-5-carboxylate reductase [Paracoccus denitrificans]MCU7427386.1 pyrroline-5-carboxylate reductase [Paracoccus denitrificans]QAR29333.1 pyrroline-5-carboxylate reductase [Paracoccus denitrificans]UPV98338.1 pyrroline-5-carboxylate reductase [Paracoccus denitrificans]
MKDLNDGGVLVVGCGRMGGALLDGWIAQGLQPASLWIEDPHPGDRLLALAAQGAHVNAPRPARPAVVLLAVKPQMMAEVLAGLAALPADVPVLSVAAGVSLQQYGAALGDRPIIRAMPNTPALVGRGITAIIGNDHAGPGHLALATRMFSAVGEVVALEAEAQIDAVTAISGSGPAYLFLFAEALEQAARALGLPEALARQLARGTVGGAAAMMVASGRDAAELRREVTSPAGTTAAALAVLMRPDGLPDLIAQAAEAARDRSVALGQ